MSLPCSAMLWRNRRPTILELAQIAQPLFEGTELHVGEAAGRFLAVPRDEGDGGAAVEQRDGRLDLRRPDAQLGRDLFGNGHGVGSG